jgi:hypothetical protein
MNLPVLELEKYRTEHDLAAGETPSLYSGQKDAGF